MGFLIVLAICAVLGAAVSSPEKKALGAVLGLFLGPLGVLIAALACRSPRAAPEPTTPPIRRLPLGSCLSHRKQRFPPNDQFFRGGMAHVPFNQ